MTDYGNKYPPDRKPPVRIFERLRALSKQGRPVPDVVPYPNDRLRAVIGNQLVVNFERPLVNPNAKLRVFGTDARTLDSRELTNVTVKRVSHCNPNLVLLEGLGKADELHLLTGDLRIRYSPEEDHPPPKVRSSSANDVRYSPEEDHPPPKVRSSSGGGELLVDYPPASFDSQLRRILAGSAGWSAYPIVAVMDTGIDFAYPNTSHIPIQHNGGHPMCGTVEPDYIGWDFVHDQNNPYDDDERNKHGSRIAAIICRVMAGNVRILPLKVIDKEGFGTLFDIFSGFEYLLSERLPERPKVINASWGFYSEAENPLLTDYIQRLNQKQIWLVNAAGNRGDVYDDQTVNLDEERRLPACASEQQHNVLTITTVSGQNKYDYQIVENFSSTFVNVGIGSGPDGRFREPLVDDNLPQIKGSSYATPYASAFVASAYQVPNDPATRNNVLQAMPDKDKITALESGIDAGFIVKME